MSKRFFLLLLLLSFTYGCLDSRATNGIIAENSFVVADSTESVESNIDSAGMTIEKRFEVPAGFKRIKDDDPFTKYLRELPLFPLEHQVKYFNGSIKNADDVYCSVVDLPIGSRDRHQCADAVMNVRAHYLYEAGRYDEIHFNFTNGFRADYSEWRKGKRISVKGNKVSYFSTTKESKSYTAFLDYLQTVYAYAGTHSLEKELILTNIEDLKPGDVFIKGGFPGHAILVVDVVKNDKGEKKFMLAQSYMPAQELQVLINPSLETGSPWYDLSNENRKLITPEWIFSYDQLKRFQNE